MHQRLARVGSQARGVRCCFGGTSCLDGPPVPVKGVQECFIVEEPR